MAIMNIWLHKISVIFTNIRAFSWRGDWKFRSYVPVFWLLLQTADFNEKFEKSAAIDVLSLFSE